MNRKLTGKEVEKVVLAAIDLEAIEQSLDDADSKVEASITPDQKVKISRDTPPQEFIVSVSSKEV